MKNLKNKFIKFIIKTFFYAFAYLIFLYLFNNCNTVKKQEYVCPFIVNKENYWSIVKSNDNIVQNITYCFKNTGECIRYLNGKKHLTDGDLLFSNEWKMFAKDSFIFEGRKNFIKVISKDTICLIANKIDTLTFVYLDAVK